MLCISHMKRYTTYAVVAGLAAALTLGGAPVAAYADAQSELAQAEARLAEIGAEYQRLSDELLQAGADLEETNAKIDETKQKLEESQQALASNVSVEYKGGGSSLIQIVLGATDFNDLISRVFYANKVNDAQAEAIQEVQDLQDELEQQKSDQEQKLEETQQKVDEQAANQAAAMDLVNSLSAEVKAQLEEEARRDASLAAGMQSAADGEDNKNNNSGNTSISGNNGNASDTIVNEPEDGGTHGGGIQGNDGGTSKPNGGTTMSSPIAYALAMAGAPYVSGGESMAEGGFDCSGLVYYAYRQVGITLPRSSGAQASYFRSHGRWTTNRSQLQYGDVVFFSGHVAFYVGNNQIFGARRPGTVASTTSMDYFPGFIGGGQLYM